MIAAEQDTIQWKAGFAGDGIDTLAKAARSHAGVTAELIHLVAGGLDQQWASSREMPPHGGLKHPGVSRAYRVNAALLVRGVIPHQFEEEVGHGSPRLSGNQ